MILRCSYCSSGVIVPFELRESASQAQPTTPPAASPFSNFTPAQFARLQQIAIHLRQKHKLEAIKLYRETFGVGLKEAYDAIELLEKGEPLMVPQPPSPPLEADQLAIELRQLIQQGDKVEAVKRYRDIFQVGLKEAKDAVDSLETSGQLPLPGEFGGALLSTGLAETMQQANTMIEIVQLVQSGQEDAAIELYQRAFGASFADAQQVVNQISLGITSEEPVVMVQTSTLEFPTQKAAVTTAGFLGGLSCLSISLTAVILLVTVIAILIALASSGGPLEGVWNQINPLAYARVAATFGAEGSGAGLLDDPRSIAIDPSGNLYIGNYSDGRVQKFEPSGAYQLLWNIGVDQYLSSMAADRAGNVHAVYRGDVWKYDGASGRSLGQLTDPGERWFEAVAATADGGLYAAVDSEDILRFDADVDLVFSLTDVPATQSGDPDRVDDITVDGVGNIYLLTDGDQPIQKYSPQGRLLLRFGSDGDEPGQFRAPSAIAVDGQGRIYVSDIRGIQVFAPDGRYLDRFDVEGYAFDMAFNPQGELWVVSNLPKIIQYRIVNR
jgi:ribosomal protein L7/L12/streptogramin lyase